jgi:hypothetical protein
MSRRAEVDRERERTALLDEIDAANAAGVPLTAEQKDRIARSAADDYASTWASHSVVARREQVIAILLADLLATSGVEDAEPGSMTGIPKDEGTEFSVVSRTRGRVSVGQLPYALVRAELAQVLPLSRPKAAAVATHSLESRTDQRVRRTAELTAQGLTARQIGEQIASEEGQPEPFPMATVRGWRRSRQSRDGLPPLLKP